jgi:hypothetical protein
VNLGVKGGPGHPAFGTVPWRTPDEPGHYCIQVRLDWLDDVNPDNNIGQENTTVAMAQSPATFTFRLRNDTYERRQYRFDVDTYRLPRRRPCPPEGPGEQPPPRVRRERPGTIHHVPDEHDRSRYPVPVGWSVALDPAAPFLARDEEVVIQAVITPPEEFHGRQAFNVNAFHEDGFAGGVTLYVERP